MSALFAVLIFAVAEAPVSDSEIWNRGVDYYRAGDVTNTLQVMRPLMASRDYAARAAEVVAKLELECGNREEAAAAAQIALRANPAGERENRNFTRSVDRLPELREKMHVEALLKAAQGQDPAALLRAATYDARAVLEEAGTFRTNQAEVAVARADALAARAEKLADSWVPVRAAITQSVTNREQAATILEQVNAAESITQRAAKGLGDLSDNAYADMAQAEQDFTRFLKLVIAPPEALEEDFLSETNALTRPAAINERAWQNEALDYTRAFRARFPMWARAYEQQAQSDTNKPPFTAEDQAKISALATELEKVQLTCQESAQTNDMSRALKLIEDIRALMPKDGKDGGAGQPQAQPQQPNPDERNQKPSNPKNEQDKPQDKQDQQKQNEQQAQETPRDQQELEAMLKKAEERNDEHEAEKKALMRKAPLPPNERDW